MKYILLISLIFISTSILAQNNEILITENKGQVIDQAGNKRPDIFYTGICQGVNLFFRKNSICMVFKKFPAKSNYESVEAEDMCRFPQDQYRMDLEFLNTDSSSTIVTEDVSESYSNFYSSHSPKGISNVRVFKKIKYSNIYPNIDIVFYGIEKGSLKYDFIIKPGGDPDQIIYRFTGAESSKINKNGELTITNPLGGIKETKPYSYQKDENTGKNLEVGSKYVIRNANIHFNISDYDITKELIIDPWATFFGGSNSETGLSITHDSTFNIILTGYTQSVNFPVSIGAFQNTLASSISFDAFLIKLDPEGNRLFATYFGGTTEDRGTGISTDNFGNIYIAGITYSDNFPVTPDAFQSTRGTDAACFLSKFDSFGNLLWSTFYGGNYKDEPYGLTCDRNNNAIMVGITTSTNFPVSPTAFQTIINGVNDAFVVKFSPSGNRLWATLYGGNNLNVSDDEIAYAVAADSSGNIFFTGQTPSLNFPLSLDALQTSNAGTDDCFLVKLDSAGNKIYSTYFGGSGLDSGFGIGIDTSQNVILSGTTRSYNFPVTPNAYQTTKGLSADQFIAKFSNNCVKQWTTYCGGGNKDYNDNGNSLSIADCNKIAITGTTYSNDYPVTSDATQNALDGIENSFITVFNTNGSYIYSTYYGTHHHEYSSITTGKNNSFTITGWTDSQWFTATDSAFQPSFGGGNYDIFIANDYRSNCIDPEPLPPCDLLFEIPNVFTPNDDRKNDFFYVPKCYPYIRLSIYNRWGEEVFFIRDPSERWDGNLRNGLPVPDGTYYYLIEYGRPPAGLFKAKGFITLIR